MVFFKNFVLFFEGLCPIYLNFDEFNDFYNLKKLNIYEIMNSISKTMNLIIYCFLKVNIFYLVIGIGLGTT